MMYIQRTLLTILVTLALTATPLNAKETIGSLYKAYQTQLSEKKYLEALDSVKRAYYLSKKKNGSENDTTHALEQNYTQLYVALGDKGPEYDVKYISEILNNSISYIEDNQGDDSLSLIDPLMTVGSVHLKSPNERRDLRKGLGYFNRAIDIASKHDSSQPTLAADLSLEAANLMLKRGIDYSRAERYTMQAYSGYKAHLPAGSEPLAKATFAHAKINFLNKDYQDSNTYFLELIEQHEQAGVAEHPRVLQAYAFMVQNYEELGESDQATIYTRKIGQARPWDDNQDQKPIYLPVPDYQVPSSSGFGRIKNKYESEWSRYRLTIDESGFVSDFELQDSSGNKRLNKAIEKVLPKWRFAPKFVDGKAVVADTYFTFELKF